MSKLGAAFLTALMLAANPLIPSASAAKAPHRISRDAAWGCRDKGDLIDLLFLGLSTSFDSKLSQALADGRCAYFTPGEDVMILEDSGTVSSKCNAAAPNRSSIGPAAQRQLIAALD
jgi:hypothetical protein